MSRDLARGDFGVVEQCKISNSKHQISGFFRCRVSMLRIRVSGVRCQVSGKVNIETET
jgi:hypothetical protein